jgi:hypothetical protein
MSNYNSQLQSNNTDLQTVLQTLQTKAAGENLDSELNTQSTLLLEQDTKIAELAEVLANKAGGGSVSYDTCTVKIDTLNGTLYGYSVTCFDGSEVVYKYDFNSSGLGENITLTDVICGSSIAIMHKVNSGVVECSNITSVDCHNGIGSILIAPNDNGTMGTIRIGNNSGGSAE